MAKSKRDDRINHRRAASLLKREWSLVSSEAERNPKLEYVNDKSLTEAISRSINSPLVAYRFCLPIQILGKLTNPRLTALSLQRGKGDTDSTSWDARSLGSKVIAPFNNEQEAVLGTSQDPYVGKPMRTPRMERDDPSKRDIRGWNTLVNILETVDNRADAKFNQKIFRQVLLEVYRRQQSLRFTYSVPPRVSLEATLTSAQEFITTRSGGDRALALAGALFDVIGSQFGIFAQVSRAKINASDEATGQAADLECLDAHGNVVIAVEVKDRELTLADFEGTISKTRNREIREVFFTAPRIAARDAAQISQRISTAFAGGQNFYVFDLFDLARPMLALGAEKLRVAFLKKVGEHLDNWNTQPSHRQAWKGILESL
jgi:hypothetical protein